MIVNLNREEMLGRWMLLRGYAPLRGDAEVMRTDGVDLSSMLEGEMRRWYLECLDSASPRLLDVVDVADKCRLEVSDDASEGVLHLPEGVRRIVAVRLGGWRADAVVVAEGSMAASRELNVLTRGGAWHPVAVIDPSNRRAAVRCLPDGAATKVRSVRVVIDSGPDVYRFDESLLPTSILQHD